MLGILIHENPLGIGIGVINWGETVGNYNLIGMGCCCPEKNNLLQTDLPTQSPFQNTKILFSSTN
jgi:hypothetical protein